jgi:PAS domain S-box-containing protein
LAAPVAPVTILMSVLPRYGKGALQQRGRDGADGWGDEVAEQHSTTGRPCAPPLRVVVNAGGEIDTEDLAGVLEAMPAAFFFLDRQWRFCYINEEMDRMLHLPREELLGRPIWNVYPRMVGSRFETAYREAVTSGRSVAFEAPYTGELPGWYEVRAWPRPDGLAVFYLDVTARHTAEEAAQRAAARLDLLARVNAELAGALDSV